MTDLHNLQTQFINLLRQIDGTYRSSWDDSADPDWNNNKYTKSWDQCVQEHVPESMPELQFTLMCLGESIDTLEMQEVLYQDSADESNTTEE